MIKNSTFLILFLSIIFFGCSKKVSTVGSESRRASKFAVEEFDFEYFSTRAKIAYNDGNKKMSANANIRVKKDSMIWISISPAFGIEAARALATPDSLIFLDRLNKVYSVYDYEKLSQKFNFKLDYDILQSILLGNPPMEISPKDKVRKNKEYFILKQNNGRLNIENQINRNTLKLENVLISEDTSRNTLNLAYSDFQKLENQSFPHFTIILLNYETKKGEFLNTEVKIQHNRTEISHKPLTFPFNVSKRYERR